MAFARRGREFRVELATDEPGMIGEFHHLRQIFTGRARGNLIALRLQQGNVSIVYFVAMAMPLVDPGPVNLRSERAGLDRAGLRAKTHGAAQVGFPGAALDPTGAIEPFGNQRDHRMRRIGIEFRAVGTREIPPHCARIR